MTNNDKHIYCVGKSKSPRCFRKNTIPVNYYSNSKAWMTKMLWTEILKDLDIKVKEKNKKMFLFVDNASCHQIMDDAT